MTGKAGPMRPVRWPVHRQNSGHEPADSELPAIACGQAEVRQATRPDTSGHERKPVILSDLLFPSGQLEADHRPAVVKLPALPSPDEQGPGTSIALARTELPAKTGKIGSSRIHLPSLVREHP